VHNGIVHVYSQFVSLTPITLTHVPPRAKGMAWRAEPGMSWSELDDLEPVVSARVGHHLYLVSDADSPSGVRVAKVGHDADGLDPDTVLDPAPFDAFLAHAAFDILADARFTEAQRDWFAHVAS